MFIKEFLKRFAPFFLALAFGLFVASFFVSIALPNIRVNRGWKNHREYHRKLEFENQRLREENFRLRREAQRNASFEVEINELVPPPPPLPVQPPAAPRRY